eukprot:gnl/MRDRNA2_/MRDRNA2_214277_c0_seq1.p1 gnl/MRDRNA2_/MRDRNA2_214277_c0~~gnl/MRDRNA2_/MRDRNA2_214277_c0_seq1.p1  ORF type:complete len:380 (+),score=48.93 gnl/MRDRNA2_/MRDRNA2_214277_c0_seq1:172-1140(+)
MSEALSCAKIGLVMFAVSVAVFPTTFFITTWVALPDWKKRFMEALKVSLGTPAIMLLAILIFAIPSELLEMPAVQSQPWMSIAASTLVPKLLSLVGMAVTHKVLVKDESEESKGPTVQDQEYANKIELGYEIIVHSSWAEYLSKYMAFQQADVTEVIWTFFLQGCAESGMRLFQARRTRSTILQLEARLSLASRGDDESAKLMSTYACEDKATKAKERIELVIKYHSITEYLAIVGMAYSWFLRQPQDHPWHIMLQLVGAAILMEVLFEAMMLITLGRLLDVWPHRASVSKELYISIAVLLIVNILTSLYPCNLPDNDWWQS